MSRRLRMIAGTGDRIQVFPRDPQWSRLRGSRVRAYLFKATVTEAGAFRLESPRANLLARAVATDELFATLICLAR